MILPTYLYNGARSMVILHEIELRKFLIVWKEAKSQNLKLMDTNDQDYRTLETLLCHVLKSARSYMTWMCEKLGLPDPEIEEIGDEQEIVRKADYYIEHLIKRWQEPLKDVSEERFYEVYKSRWNIYYCIDAMLEHAVMHPIRHRFQLEKLIQANSIRM